MGDRPKNTELRMWLAVRKDLDMPAGKLAVQAGHAFSSALLAAHLRDPALVAAYQAEEMSKAVVGVKNLWALERVARECGAAGLDHCLVTDAGRTVFEGPTRTVCAFGPCRFADLPKYLQGLNLLGAAPARDTVG